MTCVTYKVTPIAKSTYGKVFRGNITSSFKKTLKHISFSQRMLFNVNIVNDTFVDDQQVCIKRIKNVDNDEISNLIKLQSHKNIINFYGYKKTSTHTFLIFELSPTDLFEYYIKNAISFSDVLSIFKQIIDSVEHCHLHSIAHLDLKMENFCYFQNKHIKLIDFGSSRPFNYSCEDIISSATNRSPEMILRNAEHLDKIDIWQVGILFFVLLNGFYPFNHTKISILNQKIVHDDIAKKWSENIKYNYKFKPVVQLVNKMLNKDPNKRLAIFEIKQEFEKII